tara:strand:+ start:4810 stop:4995 length:186 start_codon:yes stop_codon:yes gene_type:complete
MKVGDLVQLKDSVLHDWNQMKHLGVITSKYNDAVKVYWFTEGLTKPKSSQFVLKLKVLSSL